MGAYKNFIELNNPLDTFYKSQIGAIKENSKITFRVKGNFNSLVMCCKKDGKDYVNYSMVKINDYFEVSLFLEVGLYFYYFDLQNGQYISNEPSKNLLRDDKIIDIEEDSFINDAIIA